MKLLGTPSYDHATHSKIGVLLVNLGTPDAPTPQALKPYLKQFLSDPRVVEYPRLLWWFILNGIILPKRCKKSAHAYQQIWTENGSPLLLYTREQAKRISQQLPHLATAIGMSYGTPSIADGLQQLKEQNCQHLLILPLYPQYASATTGSVFCDVTKEISRWRRVPHLRFIADYCNHPLYIKTLADSIKSHTTQPRDLLLFSFHGTPIDMLLNGDPYHCLCHKTARLAANALQLNDTDWTVTFQSRFGNKPWLQPYTDETLKTLPNKGIKKIQVVCPAFASDCLETLEEIAQENRDIFMAAGGEHYSYIPALNATAAHIDFLCTLITDAIGDWQQTINIDNTDRKQQQQLYNKLSTQKFYQQP